MIKSVTVKDQYGKILIKVIYRKNGHYETDIAKELHNRILIEIRDENNAKVLMGIGGGVMNNDKY